MSFPVLLSHLYSGGVQDAQAKAFLMPLNSAMSEFGIVTGERPAAFLAQTIYESAGFRLLSELWGPTEQQRKYDDGGPLAQRLGNPPGTGRLYRGYGLIQVTGLFNLQAEGQYFGKSVPEVIAWLQTPTGACRASAHWWRGHGCNELADAFDVVGLTRKINGGTNGLEQRTQLYRKISEAMNGS